MRQHCGGARGLRAIRRRVLGCDGLCVTGEPPRISQALRRPNLQLERRGFADSLLKSPRARAVAAIPWPVDLPAIHVLHDFPACSRAAYVIAAIAAGVVVEPIGTVTRGRTAIVRVVAIDLVEYFRASHRSAVAVTSVFTGVVLGEKPLRDGPQRRSQRYCVDESRPRVRFGRSRRQGACREQRQSDGDEHAHGGSAWD